MHFSTWYCDSHGDFLFLVHPLMCYFLHSSHWLVIDSPFSWCCLLEWWCEYDWSNVVSSSFYSDFSILLDYSREYQIVWDVSRINLFRTFQNIPQNTRCFYHIPEGSTRFQNNPVSSRCFQKILEYSILFWNILESSRVFYMFLTEDSRLFWKIPDPSRMF